MTGVLDSSLSQLLSRSRELLEKSSASWPEAASGFAFRVCRAAGISAPTYMSGALLPTDLQALRRTPELAAYGYVLELASDDVAGVWSEALGLLRGREIYPSDRQSFIFNPVEILGVACGVSDRRIRSTHGDWLVEAIKTGIDGSQFKTWLSLVGAHGALTLLGSPRPGIPAPPRALRGVSTAELLSYLGIGLTFLGPQWTSSELEAEVVRRIFEEPINVSDAAEAAILLAVISRELISAQRPANQTAEDLVVMLARRFPLFVDRLQSRHGKRPAFEVKDEYDVQDLLHGILKLHFDDVRPEEWTPGYAGNSSRTDFILPAERVAVEAKMTRNNLGQKEVVNELTIDATRYSTHPDVDTLVCVVYDPQKRCANPTALEKDVEKSATRLKVKAVVCPRVI